MKVLAICLIVLIVLAEAKKGNVEELFKTFKHKYNKKYVSITDETRRFAAFKDNLVRADWMNANTEDNADYGITEFSDLNPEEFQALYLNGGRIMDTSSIDNLPTAAPVNVAAPDSFDWRDQQGVVSEVKNQGQCGSCWAFSTTGNVEGRWFISKKSAVSLSEQFLVDCDHDCTDGVCDAGCMGGLMWTAMTYIIESKGIPSEKDYPYIGIDAKCHNASKSAMISKWEKVSKDEEEIKNYLYANGPISVGINANPLQLYRSGVLDPLVCNPKALDHGVLIVGYGAEKGKDFWIVKNSWGSSWGEKGFFRIIRGKGKCGINTMCVSSII
jgi:C1A family cysteine protease